MYQQYCYEVDLFPSLSLSARCFCFSGHTCSFLERNGRKPEVSWRTTCSAWNVGRKLEIEWYIYI